VFPSTFLSSWDAPCSLYGRSIWSLSYCFLLAQFRFPFRFAPLVLLFLTGFSHSLNTFSRLFPKGGKSSLLPSSSYGTPSALLNLTRSRVPESLVIGDPPLSRRFFLNRPFHPTACHLVLFPLDCAVDSSFLCPPDGFPFFPPYFMTRAGFRP